MLHQFLQKSPPLAGGDPGRPAGPGAGSSLGPVKLLPARAPTALDRVVTGLDKFGHVAQQPPVWAALSAAMAAVGPRGRRAALRGIVGYFGAAGLANLVVKPLVKRPRPPEAQARKVGPVTSSFPSGHGATHVALVFSASQELPAVFPPLAVTALAAHWSIVRTGGHYLSDVMLGGFLGLGVALALRRWWPPSGPVASTGPDQAGVASEQDQVPASTVAGEGSSVAAWLRAVPS